MRTLSLALALAALPSLALADNDTAYKALRIFGKKFGDQSLNHVVEVRGRAGSPQPQVWKITAGDAGARGGVTEADIQRGKVISQRNPTARAGVGTPLDLNQLNLDSDGAFTVVNQEMERRNAPFDRIDFVLRSAAPGRPPVWYLELFDGSNGRIATFEVSADSGTILQQNVGTADPYADDRSYVDGGVPPPQSPNNQNHDRDRNRGRNHGRERDYADSREYSRSGEPFRGVGDFFHRLGKRMEHRGTQLKRFFGGD
jgi:hypothetical protein